MNDYLYNSASYWIGSPNYSSSNEAVGFSVNSASAFNAFIYTVTYNDSVRPVITLKANTRYTGTGTLTDPYIVITR